MIKAVIFDLDGTILNTIADLATSVNYALVQKGYKARSIEEIRSFIGDGIAKLVERAIGFPLYDADLKDMIVLFKEYYNHHYMDATIPYKNIIELMKELKKRGISLAVLSNKYDSAVKSLCEAFFHDLLDECIGEGPGVPKKPDPKGLIMLLDKMDISPEEALYVGDSGGDITVSQFAGVSSVAVTWGFRTKEELAKFKPTYFIDAPLELISIIEKENNSL